MHYDITLLITGYYIGRSGMDIDSFFALIEAITRGDDEDE